jgi:geranylgeranyl reductase family
MYPLTQKKYDIIIIGAGPAGSLAAKYAVLNGAKVLMVEKKQEIGTPIQCAGFIPEASEVEELIPELTLPAEMKKISKKCILSKTKKQRLIAPNLKDKEFDVSGFVLDRRLFDSDLAEQAVKEGADMICGTAAKEILSGSKEHTVKLNGVFGAAEVTGKIIIGADGPNSIVGKTFGLSHSKKATPDAEEEEPSAGVPYERGIGFEYKMTNVDIDTETLEMYFGNEYVPGGYVWIFPEGDGKANVGIGLRNSHSDEKMSARSLLNKFITEHPIASEKLKDGKIMSIHSGIIPVSGAPDKTATHSAMVVGDAAGHVMATNGGGIPFAMAAGKIAGEIAAAAALEGACGRQLSVIDYEKEWRNSFGGALDSSVQARKMMDKFVGSDKLLNAAFKLIPADKFKELQCGSMPSSLKKGLDLLLR